MRERERHLYGLEHLGDEIGRQLEVLCRPLGEADDLRVGVCAPGAARESIRRPSDKAKGKWGDEARHEAEIGAGRTPRGFQVKASL